MILLYIRRRRPSFNQGGHSILLYGLGEKVQQNPPLSTHEQCVVVHGPLSYSLNLFMAHLDMINPSSGCGEPFDNCGVLARMSCTSDSTVSAPLPRLQYPPSSTYPPRAVS